MNKVPDGSIQKALNVTREMLDECRGELFRTRKSLEAKDVRIRQLEGALRDVFAASRRIEIVLEGT